MRRTGPGRIPAGTLALGLVFLLAVGLRVYGLGTLPFEQDELYTLRDATDLGASAGGGPGIKGRPLYYLMQHLLLYVLPPTPLLLRLPAFLFGILGVWMTWRLARISFGTTAAVVAAGLVAIAPWHLYASQFARYWTLVYLLAAAVYLLLPRAIDADRGGAYGLALLALVAGGLTHPTFAFPLAGVVLAVHLVGREGQLRWQWPTRRAWAGLWGPLLTGAAAGYAALKLTGSERSLTNWGGRGLEATLRLIPAIVQWLDPAICTAAVVGVGVLIASGRPGDRRWAAMAGLGALSTLGLLVAASSRTDVYADYAMAMLPLVFVTIGGAVQRAAEGVRAAASANATFTGFAAAAGLVLAAAVLPGTVSHLADGTRFDYRPAYDYIRTHGSGELVVGWPIVVKNHYAPDLLPFRELRSDTAFLADALQDSGGFWLVSSYHRHGMAAGGDDIAGWIDARCRRVLRTERLRLDYRLYRVELHWCGDRPPTRPGMAPTQPGTVAAEPAR